MISGRYQVKVRDDFCVESRPDSCSMVIFGVSGDVSKRKVLPSLFGLYSRGLLPEGFTIIGFARSDLRGDFFKEMIHQAVIEAYPGAQEQTIRDFLGLCSYLRGDYAVPDDYKRLAGELSGCPLRTEGNRLFYVALPPHLYNVVPEQLKGAGLLKQGQGGRPWARMIFEKPFGRDLDSALELDSKLAKAMEPDQIYRIDHYMGKETVQSILMLRFANAIFEPLWNRLHISHVQITAAETLGMESRGAYYDQAGCLRDMFQNHMLQLLTLVAMEPPISFLPEDVRDERLKLLKSIRPFSSADISSCVVRGQYGADAEGLHPAYRREKFVPEDSVTETYVAARLMVDNWRWRGVPLFLRSGKRLAAKKTEIAVFFRNIPHSVFPGIAPEDMPQNTLVLQIQPEEGINMSFQAKKTGPKWCMSTLSMSFDYREIFGINPPESYERLLMDAMLGDQTLFWRREEVRAAWSLIMPVLDYWATDPEDNPLYIYPGGSWGPTWAKAIISPYAWRD